MIGNFLEYIQFHKIPANVLMREIHPLGLVPYNIIMNALAYQVQYLNLNYCALLLNQLHVIIILFCCINCEFNKNVKEKKGQAHHVAGRPGKYRPRKTVTQSSEAAGARSFDVRPKLTRSVRFEYDAE